MKKFLTAMALCAASAGAWAQTFAFSLLTDDGLQIGSGTAMVFSPTGVETTMPDSTGFRVQANVVGGTATLSWATLGHITGGAVDAIGGMGVSEDVPYGLGLYRIERLNFGGLRFNYVRTGSQITGAAPVLVEDTRYAGAVVFASSVPEPSEYAMLLAGLGVVGAVVHRRRRLSVA